MYVWGGSHNRGADKSLARPWKETSCSDQELQHYTKNLAYKQQLLFVSHKSWYGVVDLVAVACFLPESGLGLISTPVLEICYVHLNFSWNSSNITEKWQKRLTAASCGRTSWKRTSNYCLIWIYQRAYLNHCAFSTSELFNSFCNFKIRRLVLKIISQPRISLATSFAACKLMFSSFKCCELAMR